ncbi:MAG: thiamine pyrophosphate-binding protein [Anaplasmataceae bacterium]|nr:thiamine pyrophosphate-binding protein [Anaplasmataceae bacterium]
MRVADYIAKFLVKHNITDIFMLTGNGAMYLNDGIASEPTIKYYCARNEMTAPEMANAYARIKGSLGVACVTSGPGAANAVSGLVEAWVDSAPVLVISGQVPREHTTHYVKVPGLRTFGNAEIDIVEVVKSITKYAAVIEDPLKIRYHLEKAYHLATSGRPGPVWLDIPMDVQYAEVDADKLEAFTPPPEEKSQLKIASQKIEEVVVLLQKSKRPLLVVGQGVRQAGAKEEVKQLIEKLGIPVIFSRLGLDLLPYTHPQNMGQGGIKGSKFCARLMKDADLIISLGCRMNVNFVGHKFDAFASDATIIMVDLDEAELKKPGIKINLPIQAEVKEFISPLLQKISTTKLSDWSDWLKGCQDIKTKNPMVTPDLKRNPIDLYYFMSRLDALSTDKHIFTTDAGSNYYVGGQVYQYNHGQREVTSGAFAAMGLSIPLAIGASVAAPEKQILAVTGDGSLELNIQELKTMSANNFNIKLFVINNGGYASMRKWQDTFFEGRRLDSDEETGSGVLNLQKVADAFDLPFAIIEKAEEIDDQLKKIMSQPGPLFVEVVCDHHQKIVEPIKDLSFKN